MNSYYELLFRELKLPNALVDCAMGRISSPLASMVSPAEWFCFPPALCPIWSDASLPYYLGYWKHWFNTRPASFVAMHVESGMKVQEIARTPEQLFCHAIMTAIVIHDRVTSEVEQFASAVGITNVSELDAVSSITGDNPRGYTSISQFSDQTPLASVDDVSRYTGSFPIGRFSDAIQWWNDGNAFELSDDVLDSWPANINKPVWFGAENQSEGFDKFLDAGNFHGAWLTLNSPGWAITEAKTAIDRLASAANSHEFSLLAEAWTSVADESSGGY